MPYSEINHFHASIEQHGILSLIWNLWDVLEKTLGTGPTLASPIQDPQIVVMLHGECVPLPTLKELQQNAVLWLYRCKCVIVGSPHTLLFRLVVNIGTAKKSVSLSG